MKKILSSLTLILVFFAVTISAGCGGSNYFHFKNETETLCFMDEISIFDFEYETNVSKINYATVSSDDNDVVGVVDNTTLVARRVGSAKLVVTVWADNGEIFVCKISVVVKWAEVSPSAIEDNSSESALTYIRSTTQLNENLVNVLLTVFKGDSSYPYFSFQILKGAGFEIETTKLNNMIDIVCQPSKSFVVKIVDDYDEANFILIEIDV